MPPKEYISFGIFINRLSQVKFTTKNKSQASPFKGNIEKLRLAWLAGRHSDVKSIAGDISENIKFCEVDAIIKLKLDKIKAGSLRPPPASKSSNLPGRSTKPTKQAEDEPTESALSGIRQKANEKELENTKIKLSELDKDVNDVYGLLFKSKEKLPQPSSSDQIIEQIKARLSKIKDAVSKREDELNRAPIDAVRKLYTDIKEREFEPVSSSGPKKVVKTNGDKSGRNGETIISEITKELKEDINRVHEVKPKLKKMFIEITGIDYKSKSDTQQRTKTHGKEDSNLDENEMIKEMTNQLQEYLTSTLIKFAADLYKEIKGQEFSTSPMSAGSKKREKSNKSDAEGEKQIKGIKKELKEDITRLKEVKPSLESMFCEITGKNYSPKSGSQQGEKTPDLDELETIQEMSRQLKIYTENVAQDMVSVHDVRQELGQLYKDITGDTYNEPSNGKEIKIKKPKTSNEMDFELKTVANGMSHGIKKKMSDKIVEFTTDLYKEIKGQEFSKRPVFAGSKKDEKGNKSNSEGEKQIKGIKMELKEDITRLKEVKPSLESMFSEITGKNYSPKSDSQQGEKTPDLDELETVQEMSRQLKIYTENVAQDMVSIHDVRQELGQLYKDITGDNYNEPRNGKEIKIKKPKTSNEMDFDLKTVANGMSHGIKKKMSETIENRLDPTAITEDLHSMYKDLTGEDYTPMPAQTSNKKEQSKVRPEDTFKCLMEDMSSRIGDIFKRKLSRRLHPSEVETEAKRLYIIVTGDEQGPHASLSKIDVKTFFDNLGTEFIQVVEKNKRKLLADVEDSVLHMYECLIGKPYKATQERPRSSKSSVTTIIQRTTNEILNILSERRNKENQDLNLCRKKLEETESDLQKAIQDREEYLNRLSKLAGARLTHDNPDIADLSDQNRPTKLAEKYSELYDNGWTDAFDIIARHVSDDQTIRILVNVLEEAYSYCSEVSEKQSVLLKTTLMKPTAVISMIEERGEKRNVVKDIRVLEEESKKMIEGMKIEVMKHLTDMRKSSWKETLRDLSEDFQPEIVTEYRKNEHVKKYVQECLELTWLMVLQSPPLVLDDSVTRKGNFNKTKYREYTQSGKKFDYLVWPALLICKGGSILQKGVAQGLK